MNNTNVLLYFASIARRDGRADDERALLDGIVALLNPPAEKRDRVRARLLESIGRLAGYATRLYWQTPTRLEAEALPN